MARCFLALCAFAALSFGSAFAESVVWSGEVQGSGEPSALVQLELGKGYQIRASGTMDLGRWWQAGKPLRNDACYGYSAVVTPEPIESLRDSLGIKVGDGTYHPDHIYESAPFVAAQNGIHFWIDDINYSDNIGSLHVEVLQLPEDA